MLTVCIAGDMRGHELYQWEFVLGHWPVDAVLAYGGDRPSDWPGKGPLSKALFVDELVPRDKPVVVFSPTGSSNFPPTLKLQDFIHPRDAVYVFGSNHRSLERSVVPDPDAIVEVECARHRDMWSFMAAAVVLRDRLVRHG